MQVSFHLQGTVSQNSLKKIRAHLSKIERRLYLRSQKLIERRSIHAHILERRNVVQM